MSEVPIVEGWTGPVPMQLLADGVAPNITGMTVTLFIRDANGAAITLGGTASITDAVNAKVQYEPVIADFLATKSPYTGHWRVRDGAGKDVFFPSGEPDVWRVRKP